MVLQLRATLYKYASYTTINNLNSAFVVGFAADMRSALLGFGVGVSAAQYLLQKTDEMSHTSKRILVILQL